MPRFRELQQRVLFNIRSPVLRAEALGNALRFCRRGLGVQFRVLVVRNRDTARFAPIQQRLTRLLVFESMPPVEQVEVMQEILPTAVGTLAVEYFTHLGFQARDLATHEVPNQMVSSV